jgi:hypothetical protein
MISGSKSEAPTGADSHQHSNKERPPPSLRSIDLDKEKVYDTRTAMVVHIKPKFESKSASVKGLAFHQVKPWLAAALHDGGIQLYVPVTASRMHSLKY